MYKIILKYLLKIFGYGGIFLIWKLCKRNDISLLKKILYNSGILSMISLIAKMKNGPLMPIISTLFGLNNPKIYYSADYVKPGYENIKELFH